MPAPKQQKKKSAPRSAGRGKKDYAVIFARSKARKLARIEKRRLRFARGRVKA
jgi:hypothetical protein